MSSSLIKFLKENHSSLRMKEFRLIMTLQMKINELKRETSMEKVDVLLRLGKIDSGEYLEIINQMDWNRRKTIKILKQNIRDLEKGQKQK